MKTSAPKPNPQFKEVTFKTTKEFNEWLDEKTKYKIEFHDFGQDFMTAWVHETGEILHANLQASIWNGRFISIQSIKKNRHIAMYDIYNNKWIKMNLRIANIEVFEPLITEP